MKTLIAWLTRRQRCTCGKFKLARARLCFDCTTRIDDLIAAGTNSVFEEENRRNADRLF